MIIFLRNKWRQNRKIHCWLRMFDFVVKYSLGNLTLVFILYGKQNRDQQNLG